MSDRKDDGTATRLLQNNRRWAQRMVDTRPDFFQRLAKQQTPGVLWIGCSDSRVPANEIVDVLPGEIFVHRNVANQVMHVDFNCLAVLQYAVEILAVRHIIVCGHYGCGGVSASFHRQHTSLIGNWLYSLHEMGRRYRAEIEAFPAQDRIDALCEINVIEQVRHVCRTTILDRAWQRGQIITVHGWIYGIHNGRLYDLGASVASADEIEAVCTKALAAPRLVGRKPVDP